MQSDRKRATFVVGVLSCALLPSAVHAYCRTTSAPTSAACPGPCPTTGTPLAWGTPQLEYALNDASFLGMDEAAFRDAIARSFAQWSQVTCDGQPVGFTFSALPQRTSLTVGPDAQEPNLNVVSELDAMAWAALGFDAHAFAKTQLWFELGSGEIVGADIAFNRSIGDFAVCSDAGCPAGSVDLENVATHEIGHFLGLAHSADASATMWCDATKGDLEKRTLGDDDVAGLCAIYGSRAVFVDPGPLADRRDPPAESPQDKASGGCAVASGGDSSASFGALTLLALLLRRKQHRRR